MFSPFANPLCFSSPHLVPRLTRQHLLEGALGPEYRYATEGSGPRRLCVDVLMEAACEMRCQPLSPAVASIAAQLDVQKLPLTVFVPPAPPAPLPKHIWSFEADVLEDDVSLGPWQLFNINHVLKEP